MATPQAIMAMPQAITKDNAAGAKGNATSPDLLELNYTWTINITTRTTHGPTQRS